MLVLASVAVIQSSDPDDSSGNCEKEQGDQLLKQLHQVWMEIAERTRRRLAPFGGEPGTSKVIQSMSEPPITQTTGDLVRVGEKVRLRRHVPSNREAFQRWYADAEIASLLRHDLRPLNERQSRTYFETLILPMSARGLAFAIHDKVTDTLIGTTALTDTDDYAPDARLFRILIGEKAWWDRGMGTDATLLLLDEAFETMGLNEVRLEVFAHNPRAIAVYERIGFRRTGEHVEYLGPDRPQLHVFEMSFDRQQWVSRRHADFGASAAV